AEIGSAISDFLRALDEETRILFIRRYFFNEAVNELAKRFELSENVISVRLHRAKERLKKYLEKEGIYL
ncbi:MAG: sigma-70 family RNA polymerase sigma factor, partial [Clostridia bacterium]|nr:sigma-70 family RNA polymerase sigma factor [Clostridia bacterium]